MVRPPLVAGLFYPRTRDSLIGELERSFLHRSGPGALPQAAKEGPGRIVAALAPHAGYRYSGPIAARTYAALAGDGIPETVVILAPAHFRAGAPLAVWTRGQWETPLGRLSVDEELTHALVSAGGGLEEDPEPHWGYAGGPEHSIEVQLPFLQFVYPQGAPSIVPIAVSERDFSSLTEAGQTIGEVIRGFGKKVVLIASADLSHYEPQERAERQDGDALGRFAEGDARGVFECVRRYPTQSDLLCSIPVLTASRILGTRKGRILGYSTSGSETHNFAEVVGYGSAILEKEEDSP